MNTPEALTDKKVKKSFEYMRHGRSGNLTPIGE
jgi:hypothetical protein